jgi:opacity protein-like surface antigen
MSLSYRNRAGRPVIDAKVAACVAATSLAAGMGGTAHAAQYFIQPRADVSVQTNSNIELDPRIKGTSAEGYLAEVSTVLGIATPRSETTIIPRLQYQNYPDLSDANQLQGDLTFVNAYNSQRSSFSVYGTYEHVDELNGELSDARFNELNQSGQLDTGTGRVRPGTTRDTINLNPSFGYKLTERTGIGASLSYQGTNYSPDDADSFIDYDFYRANVGIKRAVSPRADVTISPYVARYEARDLDSQTDSTGGALGMEMRWSKTLIGKFEVSYQQSKIDQTQPEVNKDTVNSWGANVGLVHRAEVSELILSLGRGVTPSGGGNVYNTDQLQVQYDRDLSERLTLMTAARYIRDRSLSKTASALDRDYGQADLELRYMLTRTWYVRAGYEYTSQKYDFVSGTARNNQFHVSFGYKGLERQQPR